MSPNCSRQSFWKSPSVDRTTTPTRMLRYIKPVAAAAAVVPLFSRGNIGFRQTMFYSSQIVRLTDYSNWMCCYVTWWNCDSVLCAHSRGYFNLENSFIGIHLLKLFHLRICQKDTTLAKLSFPIGFFLRWFLRPFPKCIVSFREFWPREWWHVSQQ